MPKSEPALLEPASNVVALRPLAGGDLAEWLAFKGYAVIPLAGGLKKPNMAAIRVVSSSKHPLSALLRRPLSREKVRRIRDEYPETGWGLLLDDAVVLDFDRPEAWQDRGRPLPHTPTVQTADGFQAWFRRPLDPELRNVRLAAHLEVRASGFVPLPGNIHPDGIRYAWLPGRSILEVEPAPLPQWAIDLWLGVKVGLPAEGPPAQKGPWKSVLSIDNTYAPARLPIGLLEDLRSDELARRLLGRHGVRFKEGQGFRCILPGHDDHEPSASVWRAPDGALVYRDFHRREGHGTYSLTGVYHALVAGNARKLGRGELVAWGIRLLVETGMTEAPALESVAEGLTEAERRVWDGIVLLAKCREVYAAQRPMPLGWRFLAEWCGAGEKAAGKALETFRDRGWLVIVPDSRTRLNLYAFTSVSPIRRPVKPIALWRTLPPERLFLFALPRGREV